MASWLCNAAASTTKGAKGGGIGAILGMNADEVAALISAAAASKQNAEKVTAVRSERAASSSSKSDGSKNSSSSSASARLNVNAASISAQFGI